MAKEAVGGKEHNLVGVEAGTAVVEQVRNALEDGGSFTASGNPLYEKQIASGITNNVILFLLNCGNDILHMLIVLLPQGSLKHFIAHGLISVKHIGNLPVTNGELALLR